MMSVDAPRDARDAVDTRLSVHAMCSVVMTANATMFADGKRYAAARGSIPALRSWLLHSKQLLNARSVGEKMS